MAQELAKKKRIRGGHKASATRIMEQIKDIVADRDVWEDETSDTTTTEAESGREIENFETTRWRNPRPP